MNLQNHSPSFIRWSTRTDSKACLSPQHDGSSVKTLLTGDSFLSSEVGDIPEYQIKSSKLQKSKALLTLEISDFRELERKMHKIDFADVVTCMCQTQNENIVYVGTQNGAVWHIDLQKMSKQLLHENNGAIQSSSEALKKKTIDFLTSIALSVNNQYLILGFQEGSVEVFDLENEKTISMLENIHKNKVTSVLMIENKGYFVSASLDGSIKIFDIKTLKLIDCFSQAHKDGVGLMVKTPNDRYLVSAGDEHSLKIIDLRNQEKAKVLDNFQDKITSLITTEDSKSVVFGAVDGSIRIISIQRRKCLYVFRNTQNDPVTSIAINSDNNYLISSSKTGFVQFVNIQTDEKILTIPNPHENKITALMITKGNKYMLTGSKDKSIKILELKPNRDNICIMDEIHTASITSIFLTKDEKYLITNSLDKKISQIDLDNLSITKKIDGQNSNLITSIALSLRNTILAAGCNDGAIRVFDAKMFQIAYIISDAHDSKINAISVTHDDKYIVSASEDKLVKIFDLASKTCAHVFEKYFKGPVMSLLISPDNKYIICGSQDQFIKAFEINTKVTAYTFKEAHDGSVNCLTVSGDGKYIISGSSDKSIRMFDIKYKECILIIENAHQSTVTCVVIIQNNKFIISSSLDGRIKIFDIQYKRCIHSFQSFGGDPVTSLAITRDEKDIISSSKSGSIAISMNPLSRLERSFSNSDHESMLAHTNFFHLLMLGKFLDKNTPISFKQRFIKIYSKLIIYPERWNLFHLVTQFESHNQGLLSACIEADIPFTIDNFSMTPLHHLLIAPKKDFQSINYLLDHFDELLHTPNSLSNMTSLTNLLPSILKINNMSVVQFLKQAKAPPPLYYYHTLPNFGRLSKKREKNVVKVPDKKLRMLPSRAHVFNFKIRDKLIDVQGKSQISLEMLQFYLDYKDISSDDLYNIIKVLNSHKVDNKFIFSSPAISLLIDYLWGKHKSFFLLQLIFFSVLVGFISAIASPKASGINIYLEISTLALTVPFLFADIVHFISATQISTRYYLSFIALSYVFLMIILNWCFHNPQIKSWLFSVALFCVYSKWITFLRVFDQTRNLIHIIFETIKDIRSFLIILATIVFGFSLMMFQFDENSDFNYFDRLFIVYGLIFGNFAKEDYNSSQLFYLFVVALILAVVLLNLLVAIMSETYNRVQSLRVLTDSKQRVNLIFGAMSIKRKLRLICFAFSRLFRIKKNKVKKSNGKSYLYFVKKSKQEMLDSANKKKQWEKRINQMRKVFKAEFENIEDELKEQMDRQEQKMTEQFKELIDRQLRMQQEKFDEILDIMKKSTAQLERSNIPEEGAPAPLIHLKLPSEETAFAKESERLLNLLSTN